MAKKKVNEVEALKARAEAEQKRLESQKKAAEDAKVAYELALKKLNAHNERTKRYGFFALEIENNPEFAAISLGIAEKYLSKKELEKFKIDIAEFLPDELKNETEQGKKENDPQTENNESDNAVVESPAVVETPVAEIVAETEAIPEIPEAWLQREVDDHRYCFRDDKGLAVNNVYLFRGRKIRLIARSMNDDQPKSWFGKMRGGEECQLTYWTYEVVE